MLHLKHKNIKHDKLSAESYPDQFKSEPFQAYFFFEIYTSHVEDLIQDFS